MSQWSPADSGEGKGIEPIDILRAQEQGWGNPTTLLGPVQAAGSLAVNPVAELVQAHSDYKTADTEIEEEEAARAARFSSDV